MSSYLIWRMISIITRVICSYHPSDTILVNHARRHANKMADKIFVQRGDELTSFKILKKTRFIKIMKQILKKMLPSMFQTI
jgi:hypothetical protein